MSSALGQEAPPLRPPIAPILAVRRALASAATVVFTIIPAGINQWFPAHPSLIQEDLGLQPERTDIVSSRTALAKVACSAVFSSLRPLS